MCTGDGQCSCLGQLFEVIAGYGARQRDQPGTDRDPDVAQRSVAGRAQGAFDTLGEVEILALSRGNTLSRRFEGGRFAEWILDG